MEFPFKENSFLSRRNFLSVLARGTAIPFLAKQANASAAEEIEHVWGAEKISHILPAANHERFLIKVSFHRPLTEAPQLKLGTRNVPGIRTDETQRFWQFDVRELKADTLYTLQIFLDSEPLSDPWPLKTFPQPESTPDRLRILAFTCAGGFDAFPFFGKSFFLDMRARHRLLKRGLSFQPDVVIANGDHIYDDQKTVFETKPKILSWYYQLFYQSQFGSFDLNQPMSTLKNRAVLTTLGDYQIAGLYGTLLRSTPCFFLPDDHDTLENDEYNGSIVTLPPTGYQEEARRWMQSRYYPEFLTDHRRKVGELSGSLRWGKLFNAVFYECRHVTMNGSHATVVSPEVESWLVQQTLKEETLHFAHVPSIPFVYSAGKWGEWYPDMVKDGRLTKKFSKSGFQSGWFTQHQRLIKALAEQKKRTPVILQGDLHASAVALCHKSGDLSFGKNPVHTILTGALGTGDLGFPSYYRGVQAKPSSLVEASEPLPPIEKNGFSIIDITPEKIAVDLFTWRPPEPVEKIDTLTPVFRYEIARR